MSVSQFTIRQPDDWHLHLRDHDMLRAVIGHSSANFARAIIMPNLVPPVVNIDQAEAYRRRILDSLPRGHQFEPLMTLYLTEETKIEDVDTGARTGLIKALKLYPAGATTNSDSGVRNFDKVMPVLEQMADIGLPLLVHGEVTSHEVDIFDREVVFIERVLDPIRKKIPSLRVVMEHVTTSNAVDYVSSEGGNIAATITTHHLIINRNAYLVGGIKPHFYCLPVAKREEHRLALRTAATSGNPKFFLGTDSAPHPDSAKISECGCAGIYTSINTLNCLAHVFEEDDALDQLEAFASLNGPAFYGLPVNQNWVTFKKSQEPIAFPKQFSVQNEHVTVFDPGFPLYWQHEPANESEISSDDAVPRMRQ
ncbi:dihydroorotase [Labrenzia sp. CE80]|uniref:dihydroorotase n=1 Tax=Labrenzia sp. CE80 TaxID=1788986 RepID=UPI00129BB878|nr:dihydroorotase [Labrenzia sp. CE80]